MPSFEASVETAAVRERILMIGREANTLLGRELQDVAKDAVARLRKDAPVGRTGGIVKGIRLVEGQGRRSTVGPFSVFSSGYNFAIIAQARDERTGYDYVDVTRFGHRFPQIYPAIRQKLHYEGSGRWRGHFFFADSVAGQSPHRDWARTAILFAGQDARKRGTTMARKLEAIGGAKPI